MLRCQGKNTYTHICFRNTFQQRYIELNSKVWWNIKTFLFSSQNAAYKNMRHLRVRSGILENIRVFLLRNRYLIPKQAIISLRGSCYLLRFRRFERLSIDFNYIISNKFLLLIKKVINAGFLLQIRLIFHCFCVIVRLVS